MNADEQHYLRDTGQKNFPIRYIHWGSLNLLSGLLTRLEKSTVFGPRDTAATGNPRLRTTAQYSKPDDLPIQY